MKHTALREHYSQFCFFASSEITGGTVEHEAAMFHFPALSVEPAGHLIPRPAFKETSALDGSTIMRGDRPRGLRVATHEDYRRTDGSGSTS